MKIFRTRQDVIDFATRFAPTRACQRWMETTGAITVFEGVTSPEGFPGWIVLVHRQWRIGVWVNEAERKVAITYPPVIPHGATSLTRAML